LDIRTLQKNLQELQQIVDNRDAPRLLPLLKTLIPDYTPSVQILKAASRNNRRHVGDIEAEIFVSKEHNLSLSDFVPTTAEIN
jgi:hypothetical protein